MAKTKKTSRNYVNGWCKPKKRARLYTRDGHRCVYCVQSIYENSNLLLTLDHVTPKELGGTNDPKNLVTACFSCNSAKQDKPKIRFLQYLSDQGVDVKAIARRIRNAQRRKLPEISI